MSDLDPRYKHCQALGQHIEIQLAASKDPLRKAIWELLNYEDGDIEEYAVHIVKVIDRLPPEQVP